MLIAVAPSLLLPFLLSPTDALYILTIYKEVDASSFATIYTQMRALPFDYFYVGIVGLALIVISVAVLFGAIDRHMRIGEFTVSFRRAKTRLNYNVLTALKFVLLTGIMYEFFYLLTAAIYYLWAALFGTGVTWVVLSAITYVLLNLLLIVSLSCIILWPPFMLHTGMKSSDAFKTGWSHMSGNIMSVVLGMLIMYVPFQLLSLLFGILDLGAIARTVLDGVMYAVLIPYYISLMYNIFYDVTGTERADLQKKSIWSNNRK